MGAPRSTGRAPPGAMGPPLIGETPAFLRDPFRFLEKRQRRYGDVFRSGVVGRRVVFLSGIQGARAFYDPDLITRADAHPYPFVDLFGGANMEMFDGPRHLALKTITLHAFDENAVATYLPVLRSRFDATLERWAARREVVAIPELKRAAIEAIWSSVMGPPRRDDAAAIVRDYDAVVRGLTSLPVPLPGTPYGRARAARDRLLARIRGEIAERRVRPTHDACTRMLADDVPGLAPGTEPMSDREAELEVHHVMVAGFIVYLLMAEVLRRLAERPELRDQCAQEVSRHVPGGAPTVDALARLHTCADVVREAKRIVPIVPLAFGRARRAFECGGVEVPQGWTVYLALHLNNHDPRIFRDPDRFDPGRFSPERAEHLHDPMAFIPQGAEPPTGHRCLGVEFSTTMVLTFMTCLLGGYRWELPAQDLEPDRRSMPPEPRDGLRVRLTQIATPGRSTPGQSPPGEPPPSER